EPVELAGGDARTHRGRERIEHGSDDGARPPHLFQLTARLDRNHCTLVPSLGGCCAVPNAAASCTCRPVLWEGVPGRRHRLPKAVVGSSTSHWATAFGHCPRWRMGLSSVPAARRAPVALAAAGYRAPLGVPGVPGRVATPG